MKFFQWISRLLKRNKGLDLNQGSLKELEKKCNYRFKDLKWLQLALVHRSYLNISGGKHYDTFERLEFLGDAILGLLVTEYLFHNYPLKSEGTLTRYKSVIVSRKMLANFAREIDLGKYIYLGQGEELSGGRRRESILADAFEALLGAIYIDGKQKGVYSILNKLMFYNIEKILKDELHKNYKSQLLEYSQGNGLGLPRYEIKMETGPEHNKSFEVGVRVDGELLGFGFGKSKKKAEQKAAKIALEKLIT